MSVTSKILFSRGETIVVNKDTALAVLNKKLFYLGEPTIVQYYNEDGGVETLFAIGVKSGKGQDCYRLIYPEYYKLVNKVVVRDLPPDVSDCIEGQVYLYNRPGNATWQLVSRVDSKRNIVDIPQEPMMFYDLEKNMFYVSGDGDRVARPLYDFYTKGEIDATVKDLKDLIAAISGGEGADLTSIFERLAAIEKKLNTDIPSKEVIDAQLQDLDNNKVDKETGKGLSSNDFTDEDKAKLDSIVSGEVNVIEGIKVNGVLLDVDVEKTVEIDLSEYAKTSDIAQTYATKEEISDLPTREEIEGTYATKEELDNFPTRDEVESTYAKSEELDNFPTREEIEGTYAKSEELDNFPTRDEIDGTYATKEELDNFPTRDEIEDTYATKEDLNNIDVDAVKSISVNGEAQEKDENGNVNLIISTEGVHDDRLTEDMISYLNSKLNYTYTYNCVITSNVSSITLPSNVTEVVYTAQFKSSKANDTTSGAVAVENVSNVTSGWTLVSGTVDKYTKTVAINPKGVSVASGSVSGSITNADNKSGTGTATSKSVPFSKPWFILEGNSTDVISDAITNKVENGTNSDLILKTGTSAITKTGEAINIATEGDYIWVAIPNTLKTVSVTQLGLNFLEDTSTLEIITSIGNFIVYRSKQALSSGEILLDITIK